MKEMAEGQGLEPRFTGPEPVVLPLDDPSVQKLKTRINFLGKCYFPLPVNVRNESKVNAEQVDDLLVIVIINVFKNNIECTIRQYCSIISTFMTNSCQNTAGFLPEHH